MRIAPTLHTGVVCILWVGHFSLPVLRPRRTFGRMASPHAQLWGRRIEAARRKAQLSQAQVAAAVGVTRQAVTAWEAGTNAPSDALRPRLARVLGVDLARLFTYPRGRAA